MGNARNDSRSSKGHGIDVCCGRCSSTRFVEDEDAMANPVHLQSYERKTKLIGLYKTRIVWN